MAKNFNFINPFHGIQIRTSSPFQRIKDTFNVFVGSFNWDWENFFSFKPNSFFEQVGVLDWATLFIPKAICYLLLLPLKLLRAMYKEITNTVDVLEDPGSVYSFMLILAILSIPGLVVVPLTIASCFIVSAILTVFSTPVIALVHVCFSRDSAPTPGGYPNSSIPGLSQEEFKQAPDNGSPSSRPGSTCIYSPESYSPFLANPAASGSLTASDKENLLTELKKNPRSIMFYNLENRQLSLKGSSSPLIHAAKNYLQRLIKASTTNAYLAVHDEDNRISLPFSQIADLVEKDLRPQELASYFSSPSP